MSEQINFVCLKWGDKYPAEYVNRLYHMVQQNCSFPFDFYCLTENPENLDSSIKVFELENTSLTGWWYKLSLFKKDFYGLDGNIIYLDLDIVIVGNIDFLCRENGDFIIIKNWSKNRMWNSSVMRFKAGKYHHIWDEFLKQKEYVLNNFNGDQEWIFQCMPEADIWPENKILSYKKSLKSKAFPLLQKLGLCKFVFKFFQNYDVTIPNDASIVIFHGKPDPIDVAYKPYNCWKKASFILDSWNTTKMEKA